MKKTKILSLLLSLSLFCTLIAPGTTAYAEGKTKSGSGDNGMKISKTATANPDGSSYTITLEAFATGEEVTTSVAKEIPTDIILVLDNSGSMSGNMGRVNYTQYWNTQNENNYEKRHNGGSANLWYKLDDGSYVSVSVTKTTTYRALDSYVNYKDSWGTATRDCYWYYANNLYEKVGDEYKNVTLTRVQSGGHWYNPTYTYTYKFSDGTSVSSVGNSEVPKLGNHAPLYTPVADGNDTVYTYTYTDSTGAVQTIGTSTGASTSFTSAFYQRSTSTSGGISRLQALKNAANAFAEQVDAKARGEDGRYDTSDDLDHRIAVVQFSNSAKDLTNGLVAMNKDDGLTTVEEAVNGIGASGDTYPASGLDKANEIFESNPVQEGTKRNRVIVLFTDGYPAEHGKDSINYTLSDYAIKSAYASKNTYGATVYTVGIFSGANPAGDINANFEYGNRTDKAKQLVAANRYMHYTSSNYKSAMSLMNGGNKDKNGYYLSADNADDLNAIFNKIQQNVTTGSSHSTLNSEAVVKDIISPYFTLPDGASEKDIQIDTYECIGKDAKGGYTWSKNADAMGANATINGDQVSVTGFDFSRNWCGTETDANGNKTVRGNKLVISFNVKPKENFLGGNDVPTNTDAGIYENSTAENPIMTFDDKPTVNVPIKKVTVNAQDKNVYLLGDVTADQLKNGATVKVGKVNLDLSKADQNYGLEPWQTEYVNIAVKVKGEDGNVISGNLDNLTKDTTYTIEVTVKPNKDGESSSGTPVTEQFGKNTPAANINVFKPKLTFKDTEAYYGDTVPANLNSNLTTTEWKHGDTTDKSVNMLDTAPTLDITCTPETDKIVGDKINTKQDVPVSATVKIGKTDVNEHTTFQHKDCTPACGWKKPATPGDPAFLIHVKTCTLEIKKTGGAEDESYVFEVRKDGNKYSEVTIEGNGIATLYELPVGTYTIEENKGWSWRYTADNGSSAVLKADSPNGSITCNNTKTNDQWLNGFSEVRRNIFGKSN